MMRTRAAGALLCLFALASPGRGQGALETEERALVKLVEQHKKADDKLAFLLAHAASENEWVLVWVATELGAHSDPRAVAALEKLRQHKQRQTELVPSIAARARRSLERIESTPDLARLRGKEPLAERLKIARAYALGPNAYAREAVKRFLLQEAPRHPKEMVPLLVEYYADAGRVRRVVVQYPRHVGRSLERGLSSPAAWLVAGCVTLVGELKREEYLPRLALFLCAERKSVGGAQIWLATMTAFRAFANKALPHLKVVLHTGNEPAQQDAITLLQSIGTKEALAVLKEARDSYGHAWAKGRRSGDLLNALKEAIRAMEEDK